MDSIKDYFLLMIMSFLVVSCNNFESGEEIKVINDAFLTVADTFAYHELSLRPPPPDSDRSAAFDETVQNSFAVIVPDTLFPLSTWAASLRYFCGSGTPGKDTSYHRLEEEICSALTDGGQPKLFNHKLLIDIGKYTLINEKDIRRLTVPVVGKIQFSRVVFNQTKTLAGFMALISDGEKSGIERFFILSLDDGKWKVIESKAFRVY